MFNSHFIERITLSFHLKPKNRLKCLVILIGSIIKSSIDVGDGYWRRMCWRQVWDIGVKFGRFSRQQLPGDVQVYKGEGLVNCFVNYRLNRKCGRKIDRRHKAQYWRKFRIVWLTYFLKNVTQSLWYKDRHSIIERS